jgi:hypothetical protein
MKDQAFAALFDKKDLPLLYKFAIKPNHNDFFSLCQKKWNDHNPILQVDSHNLEFVQVAKADDLVVDQGIVQSINLIIRASNTRWTYMGMGTGTTAPVAGNTTLSAEVVPRRDMSSPNVGGHGWRESAGATLRFAAIYGESIATITVNEMGIFATPNVGSAMLNRNAFSNNPVTHTGNVTAFVLASIVEFVPKLA